MDLLNRVRNHGGVIRLLNHMGFHSYGTAGRQLNHTSRHINRGARLKSSESETLESIPQAIAPVEAGDVPANENPLRLAVRVSHPPRGLKLLIMKMKSRFRFVKGVIFHKMTDEEKAIQAEEKRLEKIKLRVYLDAFNAMRIMSNRFKELMFYNRENFDSGKIRIKKPAFDVAAFDPEGNQIQFHLDSRPGALPNNVMIGDLLSPKVTDELQFSLDKPIRTNAWTMGGIITMFRSGNNGIPTFVTIEDAWKRMTQNLPMLAFPVGLSETGLYHYKDLDDCPHLLVVGGSRQGKSNTINEIICTYVNKLLPRQVQFVLFDCKNGMEFSFYEKLPHLFQGLEWEGNQLNPLIMELKEAVPAMNSLIQIMNTRMKKIRDAGCKNFNEYNIGKRANNRMPALVIVFDDYIALGLIYGAQVDDLLIILSSQSAAAGMYMILGAQYPKADRVPSMALLNFQVVIAFKLKPGASNSLLGDHSATNLCCRGRAIVQDFDQQYEAQVPYISNAIIRDTVQFALTNKHGKASALDIEEILAYALEHFDGLLYERKLLPALKDKISANKLRTVLRNSENNEFNVGGTMYRIVRDSNPTLPRRMVLVDPIATNDQSDTGSQNIITARILG